MIWFALVSADFRWFPLISAGFRQPGIHIRTAWDTPLESPLLWDRLFGTPGIQNAQNRCQNDTKNHLQVYPKSTSKSWPPNNRKNHEKSMQKHQETDVDFAFKSTRKIEFEQTLKALKPFEFSWLSFFGRTLADTHSTAGFIWFPYMHPFRKIRFLWRHVSKSINK